MIKEKYYTSLSANINTVFSMFMLDYLQMHCNTEKGRLGTQTQLRARHKHLGKQCCSIQSNRVQAEDEGRIYDCDMEGKFRAGF